MTDQPSLSSPPPFSVLVCVYGRERPDYFDQCLGSVAGQSWLADEVVLVVDGPLGADLHAVIDAWRERLPLKVVDLPVNVGPGLALGEGLKHCTYDIVARVDTDDISQPWRFEHQVAFLQQHAHLAVCSACVQEIDPETRAPLMRRTVPQTDAQIRAMLPYRNPFNHPAVVLRKSAALAVGGYRDFPLAEDYDLWLRLLAAGYDGWNLQEDLVLARTGRGLVEGYRGGQYVKLEYRLYRLKRLLRLGNPVVGALVFVARAVPRLLPARVLGRVYRLFRSA